ncbi:YhdP family protein [Piscirickettsia litoralis]|uniref:YhdP central domain-containing protein n=1 Tax=Piscirickettsia litoralis TaxID=1891921 RepID=A0ABX3A8Z5_9GAMM|nr:DUF3971 domain-containing protein [Piscirickettsia litoralis]ODN42599.1 hypothetical protein BGC07_06225 [Piscirickettsia litoralis]
MRWRFWAWLCIDTILVLALMLGATAYFLHNELRQPKIWLERFAKSQGVTLKVASVKTVDDSLLSPAFEVKDLEISNEKQGWSAKIKYDHVHFNLLKSLWHWRLSTNDIIVRDATVNFDIDQAHFEKKAKRSPLSIFPWLNAQKKVNFSNVRLNLQRGKVKDSLNFNVLWDSSAKATSRLKLLATGARDEKISVTAEVKKTSLGGLKSANIHLQAQKLLLSWFSLAKIKVAKQDYRIDTDARFSGNLENAQFSARFSLQGARVSALQSVKGVFKGHISDDKAQFLLPELRVNGQSYPKPISLNLDYSGFSWKINSTGLALKPLVPLTYLFDTTGLKYQNELDRLSTLQGYISNISGYWQSNRRWKLTVDLVDLGVLPSEHQPGVTGVSGKLILKADQTIFDMFSPKLHWLWSKAEKRQTPLLNIRAKIQLNRLTSATELTVSQINIHNKQAQLGGRVNIFFHDQESPVITSRLNYSLITPEAVKAFLPRQGVNPELFVWLQKALVAGKVKGIAVLNGPLSSFPFTNGEGQFFVQFDVSDGSLDTTYGWPLITQGDARVTFAGPKLTITGKKGLMAGLWLRDLNLEMPDIMPGVPTDLYIQGHSRFDVAKGIALLADSPLKKLVKNIKASAGQGVINLKLKIPFGYKDKNKPSNINGQLDLKNTAVDFTDKKVALTNLFGDFSFNEKGQVFVKKRTSCHLWATC